MPLQPDYLERVYAGFIGKNVGIRLGAPVEAAIWTFRRIREIYGDVRSYLKPYRTFAADDDINGPCYFIRPLIEGDIWMEDAETTSPVVMPLIMVSQENQKNSIITVNISAASSSLATARSGGCWRA